jgi:2,3-bisphosphoglycerate-independent phosphoglycerate mutase
MITPDGKADVAHTENLVAFIMVPPEGTAPAIARTLFDPNRADGALCDVTPTVLAALGVQQPADMLGKPQFQPEKTGKVLLIILDGWGMGALDETNPIFLAETPVWDDLIKNYPVRYLRASGNAVGLESGKAGNSEAGHLNIGAGRVVPQDDVRLENAMQDGSFGENPVFISAVEQAKQTGKAVHLFALLTKKPLTVPSTTRWNCSPSQASGNGKSVCAYLLRRALHAAAGSAPQLLREWKRKCAKSA